MKKNILIFKHIKIKQKNYKIYIKKIFKFFPLTFNTFWILLIYNICFFSFKKYKKYGWFKKNEYLFIYWLVISFCFKYSIKKNKFKKIACRIKTKIKTGKYFSIVFIKWFFFFF